MEVGEGMSDCRYCDLRVLEDSEGRGSPHKHGCPGLEIERLEAELEQKQKLLDAEMASNHRFVALELELRHRISELEGAINRAGGLASQGAGHEIIRQVLAEVKVCQGH